MLTEICYLYLTFTLLYMEFSLSIPVPVSNQFFPQQISKRNGWENIDASISMPGHKHPVKLSWFTGTALQKPKQGPTSQQDSPSQTLGNETAVGFLHRIYKRKNFLLGSNGRSVGCS